MASVIFLAFKHLGPSRIQVISPDGTLVAKTTLHAPPLTLSLALLNHWIHFCRVEEIDAGQESLVEEAKRLRKRVLLAESHRPIALPSFESMPIEADASVWRALLNACRLHSATKLAGTIFEKLVELEPMNAGNYVLISNIYAAAGLWMEVRQIMNTAQGKGLEKPPGVSWIVVKSQVHCFVAGDKSHLLQEILDEHFTFLQYQCIL